MRQQESLPSLLPSPLAQLFCITKARYKSIAQIVNQIDRVLHNSKAFIFRKEDASILVFSFQDGGSDHSVRLLS